MGKIFTLKSFGGWEEEGQHEILLKFFPTGALTLTSILSLGNLFHNLLEKLY